MRALAADFNGATCLLFSCVFMLKFNCYCPNLSIFWEWFHSFCQTWKRLFSILHFPLKFDRHDVEFFAFRHLLNCLVKEGSCLGSMLVFELKIDDILPNTKALREKECSFFDNGKCLWIRSCFLFGPKGKPPYIHTLTFLEVLLTKVPSFIVIF